MSHPAGPGDAQPQPLEGLVGTSAAMLEVAATVRLVAESTAPVLLGGEAGTGKASVARAIHALAARGGPFERVACGASSGPLLAVELFGAPDAPGPGRLEAARGGTLFLDEVDAAAPEVQARLVRVLEDGPRAGAAAGGPARVIAASQRELADEVARERFRDDLRLRLGVVTIQLPPLRARRDDIPALVDHFLAASCRAHGRGAMRVAPAAAEALGRHHWPGNVRELAVVIERCVVLASGPEVTPDLLPPAIRGERGPARPVGGRGGDLDGLARELVEQGLATAAPDDDALFDRVVSRVERELIAQMLAACGGVQLKAAARLGINRNTLRKKLLEHGLEEEPAG